MQQAVPHIHTGRGSLTRRYFVQAVIEIPLLIPYSNDRFVLRILSSVPTLVDFGFFYMWCMTATNSLLPNNQGTPSSYQWHPQGNYYFLKHGGKKGEAYHAFFPEEPPLQHSCLATNLQLTTLNKTLHDTDTGKKTRHTELTTSNLLKDGRIYLKSRVQT